MRITEQVIAAEVFPSEEVEIPVEVVGTTLGIDLVPTAPHLALSVALFNQAPAPLLVPPLTPLAPFHTDCLATAHHLHPESKDVRLNNQVYYHKCQWLLDFHLLRKFIISERPDE